MNITLSSELFDKLARLARGFNDTPESVIERLADQALGNKGFSANRTTLANKAVQQGNNQEAELVYPYARSVFEASEKGDFAGREALKDALDALQTSTHNRSSARMCIGAFSSMRRGELYKMSINNSVTQYFLEKILTDDGEENLKIALGALWKHIEHREDKRLNSRGIKGIYTKFSLNLKPNAKVCPECGYVFQGNGWEGIDAHWNSRHSYIMPYDKAWPLIERGAYTPEK